MRNPEFCRLFITSILKCFFMKRSSFDQLVSTIPSDERKDLLEKIQSIGVCEEPLDDGQKNDEDADISLSAQIKHESLLHRFFLWLKSIFSSTPVEVLYNEEKIAAVARAVDKDFPHLIDYKKEVLLTQFYNKLSELSLCADFFRQYLAAFDSDESGFLVFLGSVVMKDIDAKIEEEASTRTLSPEDGPRPECKVQLLRKMETILSEIPSDEKKAMYDAVRSAQWLLQFTKLPFQRFLTLFSTVIENNYTCSFKNMGNEINSFARILCNGMKISDEVFESLFVFTNKSLSKKKTQVSEYDIEKAGDFMEKAKSQITMMRMFITTVPLKKIGKIVYADSKWQPGSFVGGEDWFQKYKDAMRKIFDRKWEVWLSDCKKESLKKSLTGNFALDDFPLLPNRPWTEIWNGMPFRYELTAGFLNWYVKEAFPAFEMTLKTIMLEGDFTRKENRQEFVDAFNRIIQVSIDFQLLNGKISSNGEFGQFFSKLKDGKMRTLQAHSKIESIIRTIESDVSTNINSFCEACRVLELCWTGIFKEKTDSRYDGLTNLERISGKSSTEFAEQMRRARKSLNDSYALIRELESVDLSK